MPELASDERIAALEAENARLRAELTKAKADGWCDVCCGKGDPGTGRPCICGGSGLARDAMHGLRIELADQIDRGCSEQLGRDQLAAQVERLRAVADDVVQGGGIADLEDARAVLAETPVASLAAVRDQARRDGLEDAADKIPRGLFDGANKFEHHRSAICWLRELAAQPTKEPK